MKITLAVRHIKRITEQLAAINSTLREGFQLMSDASDQLTQAVTDVATKVQTTNDTLQVELQQIANALSNASSDPELRSAAADAVNRLAAVGAQLDQMNSTIQGIIP